MQSNDGSTVVLIFAIIILALYVALFVWLIKLKGKMVQRGADIPTSFLLFLPLVNLYWMYKWLMGVEQVTGGKVNGVLMFVLSFFFGFLPLIYAGYEASQVLKSPPATNFSPMNPQAVNQSQPQQAGPAQAPQPTQTVQAQPNQTAQTPAPQPQPAQPAQPEPSQPVSPAQPQPEQTQAPQPTQTVQPQPNPEPNPQPQASQSSPQTPGQSVQPDDSSPEPEVRSQ